MLKRKIYLAAMVLSIASLLSCASQKKVSTLGYTPIEKEKLEGTGFFVDAAKERLQGNTTKALELYKKALEKNPNDAASMYEISRISQENGLEIDALDYAKKAVKIDPKNKWYLSLLGELYRKTGENGKLIEIYKELLDLDSHNPDSYTSLAVAYVLNSQFKEAIDVYGKLENEVGLNEFITTRKAKLYEYLNEPKKALNEYEKLAEAYPFEIRNFQLLAEFAINLKDYDVALKAYEKVEKLNPEDPYIHISLAEFYKKQNKAKQAYEQLKKGFSNTKLDAKTKIGILVAFYSFKEMTGPNLDQVIVLCKSIVDASPEDAEAWRIYSALLAQSKKFPEAFEGFTKARKFGDQSYSTYENLLNLYPNKEDDAYKRLVDSAVMLFPNQPIPYYFKGLVELWGKKKHEALNYLLKGAKLSVKNPKLSEELYAVIGNVYHELKDNKNAFIYYDKTLKLNPDNASILNNYAYYLALEDKDLDRAKKMAKRAIELEPENANSIDTYAWVLFMLDDYEEALKYMQKVIDKKIKRSSYFDHYGDILYKLGERDKAIENWEKALKLDKDSKKIKQKIEEGRYIE
ncbi:MAG: tetratricopeptide repeat protein [Bacteroidales bacterium]